jgi:hypothetical protein
MKIFSNRSKWLLSFILAAFLGGCAVDNSGPGNAPQQSIVTQEELGPAIDVKNRHTDEIMAIDGVNGTAVGVNEEGTPIIYVFTLREGVAGIPASIEGFQTRTEVIGEVKALGGGFKGTYTTPMWSGVSTGNNGECAAGTIGCVVKKNDEGTDHFYLLSNNHVFARQNDAAIGEDIVQPGRYDNRCRATNHVADLSEFVNIVFNGQNNTVDAAIAEIRSGITATSQMAINSYTPTNTPQAAAVNLAVKKTGRTTGLTTGTIVGVASTINVSYSGGTARFVNQIWVNTGGFSNSGDSGSLIVTSGGTGAHPVALLFAGGGKSTFGNPINDVLNAFSVTIN